MGKNAVGWCLLAALGLALAACSSDKKGEDVDPNLFPTGYKNEIFSTMTRTLADPIGVQDAGITDPVLRQAGKEQRYVVCVRSNSRNEVKHYTGVKERIAYFYGGHLNQLIEANDNQCAGAIYKPWPELTNYCPGGAGKCK